MSALVEFHLDDEHPHVICPVDDPVAVEKELDPLGLTIGDGWWASDPETQKQPDGRWKLYVHPVEEDDDVSL